MPCLSNHQLIMETWAQMVDSWTVGEGMELIEVLWNFFPKRRRHACIHIYIHTYMRIESCGALRCIALRCIASMA